MIDKFIEMLKNERYRLASYIMFAIGFLAVCASTGYHLLHRLSIVNILQQSNVLPVLFISIIFFLMALGLKHKFHLVQKISQIIMLFFCSMTGFLGDNLFFGFIMVFLALALCLNYNEIRKHIIIISIISSVLVLALMVVNNIMQNKLSPDDVYWLAVYYVLIYGGGLFILIWLTDHKFNELVEELKETKQELNKTKLALHYEKSVSNILKFDNKLINELDDINKENPHIDHIVKNLKKNNDTLSAQILVNKNNINSVLKIILKKK